MPNPDDWKRAAQLENLEYLSREQLMRAYRNLTAEFYALERQVKELNEENQNLIKNWSRVVGERNLLQDNKEWTIRRIKEILDGK